MKIRSTAILFGTLLFTLATALPSQATVDWQEHSTLNLKTAPRGVAASADGKWTFVLTETGEVQIYSAEGALDDTIAVHPAMDSIATNGTGDKLILGSSRTKTVQVLDLEFVKIINTSTAPFLGEPNAPVEIIEFSDFQCPYCAQVSQLLQEVLANNPATVKIVFKHFPLRGHEFAIPAAVGAIAAQEQGKFWQFHDKLFENVRSLNQEKIDEIAKEIGLDMERYAKDIADQTLQQRGMMDSRDGMLAGVNSTPTLFINGRRLKERSLETIQKIIDEELAKIKKN